MTMPHATDINIGVYQDHITFKFYQSVNPNALTNGNFLLWTDVATPVQVTNPFEAINVVTDFEAISRTLTLYFAAVLSPSTGYAVEISHVVDVAGRTIPDQSYYFTTLPNVGLVQPATPDITTVTDHSVKSDIFLSLNNLVENQNPDFYIVSVEPEDVLVDLSLTGGRVTIKFSSLIGANYVNATYFKVQQKQITTGLSRWQPVSAIISLDSQQPWVYIDFPSLDAIPAYHDPTRQYLAENWKYRIRVSQEVGT